MTQPPSKEIQLAPCPCCGAKPEACSVDFGDWSRACRAFVICCPKHKDFSTKPFAKFAQAVEEWNHIIAGKPKGWGVDGERDTTKRKSSDEKAREMQTLKISDRGTASEELDVFSPAPWEADEWDEYSQDAPKIRDSIGNEIAQPFSSFDDARLMAAAPELFTALLSCMSAMCEYCRMEAKHSEPNSECVHGCHVLLEAKKALDKARG